ncbi:Histone acetyltransferase [Pleosporales sp. CAS-2024a]
MAQSARHAGLQDMDADGDYDMDDEYDPEPAADGQTPPPDAHATDAEGEHVDADGQDMDDDEDEAEPVGAVKIAVGRPASEDEDDYNNDHDAVAHSSDAKTSDSDSGSDDESSAESEDEVPWQAESDNGEEVEAAKSDPNVCIYCNQDEENDPSPDYEEYLACRVCGDNDVKRWRCSACIQNDLHDESNEESHDEEEPPQSLTRRRLSSVPKLARDLLPSHRGVDPGGHSIFKELILPDDPPDGTRSLRKRKASYEEEAVVQPLRANRNKQRPSEASKSPIAGQQASLSSPAVRPRSARSARSALTEPHDTEGEAQHTASDEDGTRARAARPRRTKPKRSNDKRPLAWIEEQQGLSLIMAFHLNNEKVQKIVTAKPKKKILTVEQERQERRRERDRERRERNRRAAQAARESPELSHYPPVQIHYSAPFPGFSEKEDETKSKPYGGVLSEADADTSKTYPTQADRKRFEEARIKAEEEWKEKQEALYAHLEPAKPSKHTTTASKIKCVNFGGWEIDTWHAAPYPEEYSKNRVLYICEFCLKYMNSDYVAWRHKLKCPAKHPPGDEIYRDGKYSFFEVDGRKNPVYCQNLCLLAKLFLGSKTLYYDVEPFLFYVMTENDNFGCHFVGYFSKEKRPSSLNNVSCILVLPIHQRNGYGQYLIDFSYLLTRVEKKTGSPEKPLSDMGLVSYRKYWRLVLCEELLHQKGPISISAISDRTGMTADDIVSALEGLRALVRDPVTKKYALRLDLAYFKQYIEKCNMTDNPKINPECLVWTPYVMGRLGQYEDGPALQTVQQRDEVEEEEKAVPEEGVPMDVTDRLNGSTTKAHYGATGDEAADAPTPALLREDSTNGESPAPGTPLANGSTIALAGSQIAISEPLIPPTRYEIFPPVPGQPAARRRPGRPFGTRRRTSTPNRARNTPLSMHTAPVTKIQLSPSRIAKGSSTANGALTPGTVSLRRTRSRLGESVTNGDDVEEGGAVKAMTINGRRSTRSSASSLGSPHVVGKEIKGKGRAKPVEKEQEQEQERDDGDADADGDYDEEGDEGMDIDAEGEDDDDIIMAGA